MEGDPFQEWKFRLILRFQSTPSVWRETWRVYQAWRRRNISIHSLRMEGDIDSLAYVGETLISIHSLRMEGDHIQLRGRSGVAISIHSLRMEGDHIILSCVSMQVPKFQSTPSVWRETRTGCTLAYTPLYFNPLPPYGGRQIPLDFLGKDGHFNPLPPYGGRLFLIVIFFFLLVISIHSLRMEGDHVSDFVFFRAINFNPLPPYGGRLFPDTLLAVYRHFNPLPPYGGRPIGYDLNVILQIFQSTPSVWRETCGTFLFLFCFNISIHSLRMEGDRRRKDRYKKIANFNPLPPYGGRPSSSRRNSRPTNFNPLPPYGGRRLQPVTVRSSAPDFNPLPPYGGRHVQKLAEEHLMDISIHSLRMEGDQP